MTGVVELGKGGLHYANSQAFDDNSIWVHEFQEKGVSVLYNHTAK